MGVDQTGVEENDLRLNPIDGALMVYVPEGEFLMGSEDDDASDDEKPEHMVNLDAYWLYQHEVTNSQFAAFVETNGHQSSAEEAGWAWVWDGSDWLQTDGAYWGAPEGPGSSVVGREDHPVVQVSWFDATSYCEWAGGRLPTEAEWEKAARGTDGRKYPWGDHDPNCSLANLGYCVGGTSPVGSYPSGASPYGALDMAGNVWEWVADWYDNIYYVRSSYENPTGPTSGEHRILRGGSHFTDGEYLRVSTRLGDPPDILCNRYGFRCLLIEAP